MDMAYKIGDYVRYGGNGVCCVAAVERMPTPDRRSIKTYYVLRPLASDGTKIFVPLDNPTFLGRMGAVLTAAEVDAAIADSAAAPLEWIAERTRRAETFKAILKEANPRALLGLCACLHTQRTKLSDQGKRLSGTDEAALKQAERLIESEFAFSLSLPKEDVGAYIRARTGA